VRAIFLSGRFSTALSARQNLFLWSPVSSWCACRIFFLSGHFSSAGRAQFFLDASAQPARHAADFFLSSSQPCMRVRGASFFFLSSRFQQLRAQFFCHSPTLLPCAQPFALVTSRCDTRAARKLFFVTSVQQCEGYRARRTFLLRSSFSFAVRSHLRRHLVLIFFGAWNLCSTLFRILRQKFKFLASSLCCF
jgi:hypothetical protein